MDYWYETADRSMAARLWRGFHEIDIRDLQLTRRERIVLDHVARGHSNAAIASALSLAPKTVRNHVSNICGKLAVSTRPELVIEARNAGFGIE